MDGRRRNRARRPAVGGGEDGEELDDSELPGPIAGARRKRRRRPSFCPRSICSGRSTTSAASGGGLVSARPWRGRFRVSSGGEKEGRRSTWSWEVLLSSRGAREQGGRGGDATAARWARPWRQGFPCRHSDDADRGAHCQGFPLFPIFRISSRALYLIEALEQF